MAEVVRESKIKSGLASFCPDSTEVCLLYVFEVWFLRLCLALHL